MQTTTSNSPPAIVPTTAKPVDPTDAYELADQRLGAAYSDCHEYHSGGPIPRRNLDFCCPVTVSLQEAIRLLRRYVRGYNAFDPASLKMLPPRCRVRLAREGGVCLYVESRAPQDAKRLQQVMACGEFDLCQRIGQTYIYRLYWDL